MRTILTAIILLAAIQAGAQTNVTGVLHTQTGREYRMVLVVNRTANSADIRYVDGKTVSRTTITRNMLGEESAMRIFGPTNGTNHVTGATPAVIGGQLHIAGQAESMLVFAVR